MPPRSADLQFLIGSIYCLFTIVLNVSYSFKFLCFCFSRWVSVFPNWPQILQVLQSGLKLVIPLFPLPQKLSLPACTTAVGVSVSAPGKEPTLPMNGLVRWEWLCGEAVAYERFVLSLYRCRTAAGTWQNSCFTPRILTSFLWLKSKTFLIAKLSERTTSKAVPCAFSDASVSLRDSPPLLRSSQRGNADRNVCHYELWEEKDRG